MNSHNPLFPFCFEGSVVVESGQSLQTGSHSFSADLRPFGIRSEIATVFTDEREPRRAAGVVPISERFFRPDSTSCRPSNANPYFITDRMWTYRM